jgi:signal peptidase I
MTVDKVREIAIDSIRAFGSGIVAGIMDLVNWHKPPRPHPKDNADVSWKKFYKYKEWRNFAIRELTAQIIIVLVLLIIIREGIGEFRYIPSESMEPTLQIHDKLFVEKVSKIFKNEYKRGDIVIFYPPAVASDGKEVLKYDPLSVFARLTGLPFLPQPEAYIKRIIALPGETVEVSKTQGVFINGHVLNEPYHYDSVEFLPEYELKKITVPEGHYFVLGDNRNYSYDSHVWGFLPKERIIGRAAFIIYRPLNAKPVISPAVIDPSIET